MNRFLIQYLFAFIFLLGFEVAGIAQNVDSCNVKSYVRGDGVLIRGVDFEPILKLDTLNLSAAMYAIDKDYFLVLHVQSDKKMDKYKNDIAVQFSDSTIILLKFDSYKDDRTNKAYDGYFKFNFEDMGYIEKYTVVSFFFTIGNERKNLRIQRGHILQRHFACLRNT
jgi:hypothetical protein